MNLNYYIILGILFFIILFAIFILFKYRKLWKISKSRKKFYKKHIKLISSDANSYKEQILDFDKLYHSLLKDLWYTWTFWDILKKNPKEIKDIDKIWKLHKTRNKLAHDFEDIDDNILRKKAEDYKKEINKLI